MMVGAQPAALDVGLIRVGRGRLHEAPPLEQDGSEGGLREQGIPVLWAQHAALAFEHLAVEPGRLREFALRLAHRRKVVRGGQRARMLRAQNAPGHLDWLLS